MVAQAGLIKRGMRLRVGLPPTSLSAAGGSLPESPLGQGQALSQWTPFQGRQQTQGCLHD